MHDKTTGGKTLVLNMNMQFVLLFIYFIYNVQCSRSDRVAAVLSLLYRAGQQRRLLGL